MSNKDNPFALTDKRILFLLKSGEEFFHSVDPEQVLDDVRLSRIDHSSSSDNDMVSWRIWLCRPGSSGADILYIRGTWSERKGIVLCGIDVHSENGKIAKFKIKPSKTVLGALKSTEGIPVPLKGYLRPTGPVNPSVEVKEYSPANAFFALQKEALFWGVEGGEQKSKHRERFSGFSISYQRDGNERIYKADLRCFAKSVEGRVSIITEIGLYGLGEKNVILERNLGLDHEFKAECYIKKKKRNIPSILVAFELDAALPIFYTGEQKENMTKSDHGKSIGTK